MGAFGFWIFISVVVTRLAIDNWRSRDGANDSDDDSEET